RAARRSTDMPTTKLETITDHHLAAKVIDVVTEAQEFAVLVTAYLKTWSHLTTAIRNAVDRGVRVHLVIRDEDGRKQEREKRSQELEKLQALGVIVHEVERLHAKAYLNERECIITSFNLLGASQDSIEIGVRVA